ncbi:hypothetical protein CHM34_10635 [Paludifilum halophilum]|uniref:Uncharacterized protein n=1 Tax=Paludifilum halophilum TaxID=1642702 RepID=A0A235B4X1_9BACL|nr:hypothetical protein CHM34_10635 [Paludifilum halophilum]
MRKWVCWLMIASVFLLPGCWDQDLLKDARLVYAKGYDRSPDGKVIQTLVIRRVTPGEEPKPLNTVHSAVGSTVRDASESNLLKIDNLRFYKFQVELLGESLAKKDLFSYMDVIYRDPEAPLTAKFAVVDGKASDILQQKKVSEKLIGEYLVKLIESGEEQSTFPQETVQSIRPKMLDPGRDFVLPDIKQKGKEVVIKGAAMFHGHRMTGTLDPDQSILFTLLSGEPGKSARFSKKVNPGKVTNPSNYITVSADGRKVKRKMKVNVRRNGEVEVDLEVNLPVTVMEYAQDRLDEEKQVKRLNKTLSKILTEEADEVIGKMKKARCDGLGVGRQLIAYHPEVWKEKKWSRDYPKVRFHPKVKVEIVGSGILN